MASPSGVAASAEQVTGTRDETYDLVSVLYHAFIVPDIQGDKAHATLRELRLM